jgi:hypothetical protein
MSNEETCPHGDFVPCQQCINALQQENADLRKKAALADEAYKYWSAGQGEWPNGIEWTVDNWLARYDALTPAATPEEAGG